MSPRGIRSMLDRPNWAYTIVPLPGSDQMEKSPPALKAAILKNGTPRLTLRVLRVV